jgi:hypothetical protein
VGRKSEKGKKGKRKKKKKKKRSWKKPGDNSPAQASDTMTRGLTNETSGALTSQPNSDFEVFALGLARKPISNFLQPNRSQEVLKVPDHTFRVFAIS